MHAIPGISWPIYIPIRIAKNIALGFNCPSSKSFFLSNLLPASIRFKSFFKNIIQERSMTFGQITIFNRPIIHLYINITVDVALPWRSIIIIPYSLQITRQVHAARRSQHQITAILKVKHIQIKTLFMEFYKFICRNHR